MGDKSPKAAKKIADQKQTKNDKANQNKQKAISDKQVNGSKKK